MAESKITKQLLATTLKQMMQSVPYGKISVSDLCDESHVSRKCFYYHFKDKEDVVAWIFDQDYEAATAGLKTLREKLLALSGFFYQKHSFYRKALRLEGQNSLTDHLGNICRRELDLLFESMGVKPALRKLQTEFCTDFFLCALKRWMEQDKLQTPEAFSTQLTAGLEHAARFFGQ